MRLINCTSQRLEEFFGDEIPRYAIMSHTWGADEVSFAEFTQNHAAATKKKGYKKIAYTCQQAMKEGIEYAWVDTCCIDKSSSAELSEAINSMFTWYKNAKICYAYLSDASHHKHAAYFSHKQCQHCFSQSRWFTRGWTLQELLAPQNLTFYGWDWIPLGTKLEHIDSLSKITKIDKAALLGSQGIFRADLDSFCVAKRMSWASHRETTRVEDMSYCLLGIFDINMPLLYGEGTQAFTRLQEEIIKKSPDDSILAWGLDGAVRHPQGLVPDVVATAMQVDPVFIPILATSPKNFESCGTLQHAARSSSALTATNLGLQFQLPLVPVVSPAFNEVSRSPERTLGWIGLLGCSPASNSDIVGIILCSAGDSRNSNKTLHRVPIFTRTYGSNSAVTVGPRAAALSTLEQVTMLQKGNGGNLRTGLPYCRQILLNHSLAFQDTGYCVTAGSGLLMKGDLGLFRYKSTWVPATMLLTTQASSASAELLAFHYQHRQHAGMVDSSFTLLIRTDRHSYLVRPGPPDSDHTKRDLYHNMNSSTVGGVDWPKIMDSGGSRLRIMVSIHEKTVYHWQIFEVSIDVARIEAKSKSSSFLRLYTTPSVPRVTLLEEPRQQIPTLAITGPGPRDILDDF